MAALSSETLRECAMDLKELSAEVAESGRAMVARVALALLQEGILPVSAWRSGEAEIPLPGSGTSAPVLVLRRQPLEGQSLFPALDCFLREDGGALQPIEEPAALLEAVAPLLSEASPCDILRILDELSDAQFNEALCNCYRASWNAHLRQQAEEAGQATFWSCFAGQPDPARQAVWLEQWSGTGHPYHPTHKTRIGMSPAEVLDLCPEFEAEVQVVLAAARRDCVAGETLPGRPGHADWLASYFPAAADAWRSALTDQGRDPADYLPLPVHPWQADHAIASRFAASLKKGDLLLLKDARIPASPLVSVRTLVPTTDDAAPHLKVSLGVRLTSVERTISPRSCEMGPRVSRLLQQVIASDKRLSATLDILPEELGLYFASADPAEREEARHLAALLRGSPASFCGPDEVVVPTTALSVASPVTAAPLFAELQGDPSSVEALRDQFADYAEALLRPLLILYLRYGIGLEAHQQNVVALYDRKGALRRFLLRDFGGIRIHEAALRAAGLDLELHPDRLTVVDDRAEVCSKITSRSFHYHIGFLISRLSRHLGVDEAAFWSEVAGVVAAVFDELRGEVPLAAWQEERAAFLERDWGTKTSFRMRLEGRSGDVYQPGPNPLRWGR